MPLTTRCNRCGRLFPIFAQQLKARRGRVDCPQCGKRFSGLGGLVDEPMAATVNGHPPAASRRRLGTDTLGTDYVTADRPREHRPRGPAARIAWGLGALLLMVALAFQLVWWKRGDLLRDPNGRLALETLCDRLGCELPHPRLSGTLSVLEPTLEAVEDPDGLELRLTVLSRAPLAQPPPIVQIELLDQQGVLAAARRFAPAEYLPEIRESSSRVSAPLIGPGDSLAVAIRFAPVPFEPSGFRVRVL